MHLGQAFQGYEPDAGLEKPQQLTKDELRDPEAVGLRILTALAWREDGKQLQKDDGVKEKFDDKRNRNLRYARDMVGATGEAWRKGIAALAAKEVLVKHVGNSAIPKSWGHRGLRVST